MPRGPRVVIADLPHHVVLRGNNRRRLFSYSSDYEFFVYLLGRAGLLSRTRIHAVTLMPNHVHLVLTPPDASGLARFVKHAAQRYAQRRNERRGSSGRLFEQRYFSRAILDERQLAVTMAYVELNPVRAGLVESPAEYAWSTYACHATELDAGIRRSMCAPTSWYLGLGASDEERRHHYADFVTGCHARGERPVEASELEVRAALGALSSKRRVERPDRSRAA